MEIPRGGLSAARIGVEVRVARRIMDADVPALRAARDRAGVTLRWKYDAVSAERTPADDRGDALERWVREVTEAWGPCGRVACVDDAIVGYVLYAPSAFLPGLGDVPTAPASADAVVLAELCVLVDDDAASLGKVLVQAAAKELFLREVAALEAFGTTGEPDPCLLDLDLLDSCGFTTHRAHSTTPRMRMDLRTARTWMNEVELALERLVGAVRPAMKPGALKPGALRPGALRPESRSLR